MLSCFNVRRSKSKERLHADKESAEKETLIS